MAMGKVKWFDNAKGFGFIVPSDGSSDVFAHFSDIQATGYRSLKEGEEVSFEIRQSYNRKQAANIRRVR